MDKETNGEENDKEAERFKELIANKIHELLASINTVEKKQDPRIHGMNLTEDGGYVWNVSMLLFNKGIEDAFENYTWNNVFLCVQFGLTTIAKTPAELLFIVVSIAYVTLVEPIRN